MKGINRTFGRILRGHREWASMSQKELAKRAKISAQYLCDVEHSRRYPCPETARRIAKVFGLELSELGYRCSTCGGYV